MKSIILLLFMALSTQSFATCADDFDNGFKEYDFAGSYFEKGTLSYNTAVELSRSNNPVFITICNHLVDSVSGFSVATDSYRNCSNSFNSAMSTCSGGDRTQAAQNKDVCVGNQGIASDNLVVLRRLLKNTCFKGSKKLENVELGKVESLFN